MITNESKTQNPKIKDYDALDKKTLDRINRLSCQQIVALKPKYIKTLTCDFDERYARLVVSKGNTTDEQRELLNAIIDGHRQLYVQYDSFGAEFMEVDPPSYFEEWDSAIAFAELITPIADMPQTAQIAMRKAESIPQLLEEEEQLNRWMHNSVNSFLCEMDDAIERAQIEARNITDLFSKMRNDSITKLLDALKDKEEELNACKEDNQKLLEDNRRFHSWYDDWQRLRELTVHNYELNEVAEIVEIDDPTVMTEAIDAIMSKYTLQKENEELRAKQEAWRDSEEYKAERTKWEKANKQRIDVQDFKSRLLKHASTYTANESEKIRSLVLNLNEILRATAWENVSPTILEEALNVIRKNEVHQVAGDLVINKNVANEINGVESGAIGFSINK